MRNNEGRGRDRPTWPRAAMEWFDLTSKRRALTEFSDDQLQALLKQGCVIRRDLEKNPDGRLTVSVELRLNEIYHELISRGAFELHKEALCKPKAKKIVLPPRLLYDGLLRRLLSQGAYERYIMPHVADMHEEYFAALWKGDEAGARWAVIRGHLYVVPSWVWAQLARLLARALGKRT